MTTKPDSFQNDWMQPLDLKKLQGWPYWWMGALLTVLYFTALLIWLGRPLARLFTERLDPNEVGDTLAGVFAPLALVWLIVGIFQQGRELRIQVQDLKESVEAQKAMAKASGGQERLQNEQFLERLYRLYKSAAEDILYQVLDPRHLRIQRGTRAGANNIELVSHGFVEAHRSQFKNGRRAELHIVVMEINRKLEDQEINRQHSDFVLVACRERLKKLAQDFARFDDLRLSVLAQFEGGDVLGSVDAHEGFMEARKLIDGYARLTA